MDIIKSIEDTAFAPAVNAARLGADDLVWFNDLKNQFKVLEPLDSETDPVRQRAKAIINGVIGKPGPINGQDLADLETWLIELLPEDDLRQKVNSLRDDCREMMGENTWNKILPTLNNQVSTADIKPLRAEARRLQQELHWRAGIQPEAQRIRFKLMSTVLLISIVTLIATLIIWAVKAASFANAIFFSGLLGASISCIQRIQSADLCSSRATSIAKNDNLSLGVTISPLLGGIFATIMVLLLAAGQVTPGMVIPNVVVSYPSRFEDTSPTNEAAKFSNSAANTNEFVFASSISATNIGSLIGDREQSHVPGNSPGPTPSKFDFFGLHLQFASGKDVVLLILWAFVAGFFERLVPDLLTRLAATNKS